eukprot:COSAG03_NODE_6775_length_1007_cov_1.300661_2_plen_114_part_01
MGALDLSGRCAGGAARALWLLLLSTALLVGCASGRNVSVAMLQLSRTANATADEHSAMALFRQAAGDADLVVLPGRFLRSHTGDSCTMDELEGWAQLSYELHAAVVVTCDTRVL